MSLIRIDHHPSRRKLATFGALWLAFLGIVGGIVLHRTNCVPVAAAIWTAAAVVTVIGWIVPGLMRIVYLGMAYAALPIGLVVSHVVLAVVYYLVLTPMGSLMRIFGYDPMHRRFDPAAETYWFPRQQDENIDRYFRQF